MFWTRVHPCPLALQSQPWQPASSSVNREQLVWALSLILLCPLVYQTSCRGIPQGTFSMGHIDMWLENTREMISLALPWLVSNEKQAFPSPPPDIDICECFLWFFWEGSVESMPPSSIVVSNPILLPYCSVPVPSSLSVPHSEVGSLTWGMKVI